MSIYKKGELSREFFSQSISFDQPELPEAPIAPDDKSEGEITASEAKKNYVEKLAHQGTEALENAGTITAGATASAISGLRNAKRRDDEKKKLAQNILIAQIAALQDQIRGDLDLYKQMQGELIELKETLASGDIEKQRELLVDKYGFDPERVEGMTPDEIDQAYDNLITIKEHGIDALREKIKQKLDNLYKLTDDINDPKIKTQKQKEYEQLQKEARDAGIDFEGIKQEVQDNDFENNGVGREHIEEIINNQQELKQLVELEQLKDRGGNASAFSSFATSTGSFAPSIDDTPTEKGAISNAFNSAAGGQTVADIDNTLDNTSENVNTPNGANGPSV